MTGYLKRDVAPKSWDLFKKGGTAYVLCHDPGAHSANYGVPTGLVLKHLGHAKTGREVKKILNTHNVIIDGRRIKNPKFLLGLMDVLSIPDTKELYRVLLDYKGRLVLAAAKHEEAGLKPCRITNKTKVKAGKTQLNLFDARNILVDKDDYKVGDTVLLEVPSQKISKHLPLEKGARILLYAGKHAGVTGIVEDLKEDKVTFKHKDKVLQTHKKYAFVIGSEKELPSTKTE